MPVHKRLACAIQASRIDEQRQANESLWLRPDLVRAYANRVLRPVEVLLLLRCRAALSGAVLELGCGAGRVTGYLVEMARHVHAIDLSPSMVAYSRRSYPRGEFRVGDLRAVSDLAPGSFDVVIAAYNVLDVLRDADRGSVLDGVREVLRRDGLLIMSSHNRAVASGLGEPLQPWRHGPRHFVATVIRLPRRLRNRRRVRPFEREEDGYAILNDVSHDFMALHYYIDRDAQERQLAAHGFTLLGCFDLDGRRVEPGHDAAYCSELHYVAQRTTDFPDVTVDSGAAPFTLSVRTD